MEDTVGVIYRVFLVILPLLGYFCGALEHTTKPHIIFIIADDLGWDDVSFHGSPQIPTKHIDELANKGVILNNYYVSPICTPTRASIMTGKYPAHLGMHHFVIFAAQPYGLPLDEVTLPQYLKIQGYHTAGVGKWHLGFFAKEYTPTFRGFDSFYGFWSAKTDYWNHSSYENNFWGIDMRDNMEAIDTENGIYGTELFTIKSRDIIKNHDVSKPLFLYISHQAVHSANPNEPLQAPFDKIDEFNDTIEQLERRKYAAMVMSLDHSVGTVYEALKEKGMENNSVIIFTSDNGGAPYGFNWNMGSNYPFRGGKDMLWEGGVRSTAFVYSPLISQKGRVSNDLIDACDWAPTLFHLAGGDANLLQPNLDGKNVWKTISEGEPSPRDEILHGLDPWRNFAAIRKGRYKLVMGMDDSYKDEKWHPRYPGKELDKPHVLPGAVIDCGKWANEGTRCDSSKSKVCLFDMEQDPCEYHDISNELPDKVRELEERLKEFNKSARPVWYPAIDKGADPAKFGGYWAPWVELKDNTSLINSWISVSTLLAIDLLASNHADELANHNPCNITFSDLNIEQNDILPNVPSDVGKFITASDIASNVKNTCEAKKGGITWMPFSPLKIQSTTQPVNSTDRFYYRRNYHKN